MKVIISSVVFFLMMSVGFAQDNSEFFQKADAFFKKNVKQGRVTYQKLKSDPTTLDELVAYIGKAKVDKSDTAALQAFYINAYNIMVIKGVVDAYPIASPLKVEGFFEGKKYTIAGKSMTLNDLENNVLRANYPDEPRFHFALVCAGLGCPPIIPAAYLPSTLDTQLQTQTKLAINNPKFTQYDANKGKLKLSQIFEWYKGDFTRKGQSLVDFVNKYRAEPLPEKTKTGYYTYVWDLNDAK